MTIRSDVYNGLAVRTEDGKITCLIDNGVVDITFSETPLSELNVSSYELVAVIEGNGIISDGGAMESFVYALKCEVADVYILRLFPEAPTSGANEYIVCPFR